MKLFSLFGKKAAEQPPVEKAEAAEELAVYSGMRVEVTALDGRMLFVAKLLGIHENQAELHQYSEAAVSGGEEPLPVRIRGYSDHERSAVYMEDRKRPRLFPPHHQSGRHGNHVPGAGNGGEAVQAAEYQRRRGLYRIGIQVPRGR